MFKTSYILSIAVFFLIIFLAPVTGHAVLIKEGYDFFSTDNAEVEIPGLGTIQMTGLPFPPDNLLFPIPLIPPGAGGVPLFQVSWRDRHGNEVGPDSVHKVSQIITPNPDAGPFDTVVRRKTEVDISGTGTEVKIDIEIVWLSLKSVDPIDVGPLLGSGSPFLVDVYVGLNDVDGDPNTSNQTTGKMRLKSTAPSGREGTIDLGLMGGATEDISDPNFLGLPVIYDVVFLPAGMGTDPVNIVYGEYGMTSIFHHETESPGGTYKVVPEPSTWLLFGLGLPALVWIRRGALKRREV